jgi:DNA helicase IV
MVELSSGTFIVILSATSALAALAWYSSVVRMRNHLAPAAKHLAVVSASIEEFLARKSYARDSQRVLLGVTAKAALIPTRALGWRCYATSEQRETVKVLTDFVTSSVELVSIANREFVISELTEYCLFFDSVESQPLTNSQRRSCVINEDSNLVLAGAGTGKTSTMIGRAGYLVASGRAKPNELLMLAFARKAAVEMQERQDSRLQRWLVNDSLKVKTFHALGLEIIGTVEGRRPDLHNMAEDKHAFTKFIDEQVTECCDDPKYQSMIIRYCGSEKFPYMNPFDFSSMSEYYEYVRTNELRTLKKEVVKSFEEVVIANFLNANSVAYTYEHPYQVDTAGPDFRQYKPDFYLPKYDVYIEHFALDKSGNPPVHFGQKKYLDGIEWKRNLHTQHGTKLVETYSYLKREGLLESRLTEILSAVGVTLIPRSTQELLNELRDSSEVNEFAILLSDFLTLFKESGHSLVELNNKAKSDIDSSRLSLLLALFTPILDAYQTELSESGQIDFADMILKASDYVESGAFQSPYIHVLVDEFQDISKSRTRLLKAMVHNRPDAGLFAVGDDWQSIYRFTGSNIAYTRDFSDHFGATATTPLDQTFRFNNMIGNASSRFVLQNPEQISKSIESKVTVDHPALSFTRTVRDEDGLRITLEAIVKRSSNNSKKVAHVLVLGRYNFTVAEWLTPAAKRRMKTLYPSLTIDFMTVHSAKGKEADFVVILGLGCGKHGFPSEKPTDPILEWLLPAKEVYPLAEERRLFYVALTRARHRVYLVYNPMEVSSFVRELLHKESAYPVCTDEIAAELMCAEIPHVVCPECVRGALVPKSGTYGKFVGCNSYPYCKYKEKPCPQCGELMRSNGRFRVCANPACGASIPICPKCGGTMVERNGSNGKFWGCSNYRRQGDYVCTHTINIERQQTHSR